MIDTISLLIPLKEASCCYDYRVKKQIIKPSRQLINQGIYFPKVAIYQATSYSPSVIKVEFSAPKLLYGNNLQELNQEDFDSVVHELRNRLRRMEISVRTETLCEAPVSVVHYSKNVILQNGYRSEYVIGELRKLDISKRFDTNHSQYRNEGSALYIHANSHQLIIYDKIADLNKPKSRAIEKDQMNNQKELFRKFHLKTEVLRFEVRLCKKLKIKHFFRAMGHNRDPTLKNVFSNPFSKKIILFYWNEILKIRKSNPITISQEPGDLLRSIIRTRPSIKPKEALYLMALLLASKQDGGIRELRTILEATTSNRHWYRLSKDLERISAKLNRPTANWLKQIDESLHSFKTINLDLLAM